LEFRSRAAGTALAAGSRAVELSACRARARVSRRVAAQRQQPARLQTLRGPARGFSRADAARVRIGCVVSRAWRANSARLSRRALGFRLVRRARVRDLSAPERFHAPGLSRRRPALADDRSAGAREPREDPRPSPGTLSVAHAVVRLRRAAQG